MMLSEQNKRSEAYRIAYKEFIKLKCRTLKDTDPQSPEEFCEKYNITKDEYVNFVDEPTFADDVLAGSLDWAKEKTPEMLKILYDVIKVSKSASDIEKFMNMVHELKKKKDEKSASYNQFNFFGSLSDEKFKQIAAREYTSIPNSQ